MVLHVYTWFMIGVVMAPTYILLALGSICLGINFWAIAHPQSMAGLLAAMFLRFQFELDASFRR
jgi:ABC-type multidrug transport system permease subunit